MKKTNFIPPYNYSGQTTFRAANKRSGVYLIKENSKLVYVGMSVSNLYRTLYRHFETWNHRSQQVVSYKDNLDKKKYTVRVVYCTPKQTVSLEKALIIKHKPRDNDNKYTQYKLIQYDKDNVSNYNEVEEVEVPF